MVVLVGVQSIVFNFILDPFQFGTKSKCLGQFGILLEQSGVPFQRKYKKIDKKYKVIYLFILLNQ